MSAWSGLRLRRRGARTAAILAGSLGAGLFAFALLGHPIELPSTAEVDGYLGGAQAILGGSLPRDPFRPMLYPLSVAGTAWLIGADCFLAARIVSVLSAAGLVLATFGLGRRLAGHKSGLLAALIVGASGSWWTLGVQATTDVLFAATFLLTVLAALHALRSPTGCAAASCGLALGLCYFTRYTASALVIAVLPAIWLGSPEGRRGRRMGWLLLGTCAGLLPHGVLTWRAFGSPFHDESWRSMAFRHFGDGDWRGLWSDSFDGLPSVLLHDPAVLLSNALDTLFEVARHALWRLLVDAPHAVALAPCVALGVILCVRRRPKESLIVGASALGYVGVLSATFFAWERLLFPLLPVLAVGLASAVVHSARFLARLSAPSLGGAFVGAAGLATIAVLAAALPERLAKFFAQHPFAEVNAAESLLERHGPDTELLSSYWAMNRHVPSRVLPVQAADSAAALLRETWVVLAQHDVDYLIVGRRSLGGSTFHDLSRFSIPRIMQLERLDAEVRIYRVEPAPLEEISAPLRVTESGPGIFVIELDLLDDVPPEMTAEVRLHGPGGVSRKVLMEPLDGRPAFSLTLNLNLSQAPGIWSLHIRSVHSDWSVRVSKPFSISYAGS